MSAELISATLVAAQSYDLVGLQTVKDELAITSSDDDQRLARWITVESAAVAKHCNRVFPIEVVLDRIYAQRDGYPQVVVGGVRPLQLTRYPVVTSSCLAGIAAPALPFTLNAAAGGALAARRYYVRLTYVTAQGETAVSDEPNLHLVAGTLITVVSPPADPGNLATGWNVYAGTSAGAESLQNAAPIAIGTNWSEPATGLIAGNAMPNYVSVIELGQPRIEGVDFLVDASKGQLTRIDSNGYPKGWPAQAISVFYRAGFVLTDPTLFDAVDAVIELVKGRYFSRLRDPAVRQENIVGVLETQYWAGLGPDAVGDLPPGIAAKLARYRVPVAA